MKDADRVHERLARIGRATADIAAPPGLDDRVLAAIVSRERAPASRWDFDQVWSSSRQAVVVSLCACAASVALALHLDATLVTTLGSAAEGQTDVAAGEP